MEMGIVYQNSMTAMSFGVSAVIEHFRSWLFFRAARTSAFDLQVQFQRRALIGLTSAARSDPRGNQGAPFVLLRQSTMNIFQDLGPIKNSRRGLKSVSA